MLILERCGDFDEQGTLGHILYNNKEVCKTVERSWGDNKSFSSCIPEGTYSIKPFKRPNGSAAYILSDPNLEVYKYKRDIPEGEHGRYLILIHSGNWAHQLNGCIAPGTSYAYASSSLMVSNSRVARNKLFELIEEEEINTLTIINKTLGG